MNETLIDHKRAIEAILMVADEPVAPNLLAQLLELPQDRIEALCEQLRTEYEQGERGFVLARVAGGFRYQSHPDLAPYLEQYVLEGQSARLSAAALETLAIVAYKQPVSRAQIAAIRGVAVDGVMRTLVQRDLVAELGRDNGPGQPMMYGTTPSFLERLGLDDLSELPPLGNFVPAAEVVEALEQGLRADGEESPAEPDATEGPERTAEPDDHSGVQPMGPEGLVGGDEPLDVTATLGDPLDVSPALEQPRPTEASGTDPSANGPSGIGEPAAAGQARLDAEMGDADSHAEVEGDGVADLDGLFREAEDPELDALFRDEG